MPGKTGYSCEGKYYLHNIFSFIKFKYKNASKMHFIKAAPLSLTISVSNRLTDWEEYFPIVPTLTLLDRPFCVR